jgi:hypothetical protein
MYNLAPKKKSKKEMFKKTFMILLNYPKRFLSAVDPSSSKWLLCIVLLASRTAYLATHINRFGPKSQLIMIDSVQVKGLR